MRELATDNEKKTKMLTAEEEQVRRLGISSSTILLQQQTGHTSRFAGPRRRPSEWIDIAMEGCFVVFGVFLLCVLTAYSIWSAFFDGKLDGFSFVTPLWNSTVIGLDIFQGNF